MFIERKLFKNFLRIILNEYPELIFEEGKALSKGKVSQGRVGLLSRTGLIDEIARKLSRTDEIEGVLKAYTNIDLSKYQSWSNMKESIRKRHVVVHCGAIPDEKYKSESEISGSHLNIELDSILELVEHVKGLMKFCFENVLVEFNLEYMRPVLDG